MRQRRHKSSLGRAGFSLVEFVLVLSIMAVLAGIALPRYGRGAARFRVEAAAKRVASDFQQAQQRAKAASGPCVLTFATATATTTTTLPTVGGVAGRTLTTRLGVPPYGASIVSATFGAGSTVTFDGYGNPSVGGTVVVKSGNETRTITVAAVSGATAITSP